MFNHSPLLCCNDVPLASQKLLLSGTQRGAAAIVAGQVVRLPEGALASPAAPLLQRHSRLLALEEAAMETDVCRFVRAAGSRS